MAMFSFTPRMEQLGDRLVPSAVTTDFRADTQPTVETHRIALPCRVDGLEIVTTAETDPPSPDKTGDVDPPSPDKTGDVDPPNPDVTFLTDPPNPDKVFVADPPNPDKTGDADPPSPDTPINWGIRVG
jgi:hypothetical protein